MKVATVGLILGCATLGSSAAFAGAESGGGGNAVVCRDARNKILSAELQDIFEGRELYQFHINKSALPYTIQAAAMFEKIRVAQSGGPYPTGVEIKENYSSPTLLPAGDVISGSPDSGTSILPSGNCTLEGLAYLDDRFGKLYVNSEIWNALPETDKAALLVHENLYFSIRTGGPDETSDRARYFVGLIASDAPLTNLFAGIPIDAKLHVCGAQSFTDSRHLTGFFIYREPNSSAQGNDWPYIYHAYFYEFGGLP